MQQPLRDVMVAAPGAGHLEFPAQGGLVTTGRSEHPVCGDEVELDLELRDGAVRSYRWRASGCPATTAVAAAATKVWAEAATPVAADRDAMEAALRQRLGHLGGLAQHEHHAVALLMRAVDHALRAQAGSTN